MGKSPKFLLTFLFLLTVINVSCYEKKPVCWQGAYLSGQLGMGWNRQDAEFANPNFFNTLGPLVLGSDFDFRSDGFIGGGSVGYNYQIQSYVLGLEVGALGSDIKNSRSSPFFPTSDTYSSNLQWLATAKARAGFAYKRLLAFVTGGWAGGNVVLKLSDPTSNVFASSNKWANGWTVGAGADYKLTRSFSCGLSYDYYQLEYENKAAFCPNCGTGVGFGTPLVNDRLKLQTLLFRLTYHFNI